MAKFRKKPIVIEAEQFHPDRKPWPEGVYYAPGKGVRPDYFIDTLEGRHQVSPEDWIITGIEGEKYPCKPNIFKATYDLVETDESIEDYEARMRETAVRLGSADKDLKHETGKGDVK